MDNSTQHPPISRDLMGRAGFEPATLGLKDLQIGIF